MRDDARFIPFFFFLLFSFFFFLCVWIKIASFSNTLNVETRMNLEELPLLSSCCFSTLQSEKERKRCLFFFSLFSAEHKISFCSPSPSPSIALRLQWLLLLH